MNITPHTVPDNQSHHHTPLTVDQNANTNDFDSTKRYSTSTTTMYLWQPPAVFSRWTPVRFPVDTAEYCCAKHLFTAARARLSNDKTRLYHTITTTSSSEHKRLGRRVQHFKQEMRDEKRLSHHENDGFWASYMEFPRNPAMLRHLLGTGDRLFVEASLYDTTVSRTSV